MGLNWKTFLAAAALLVAPGVASAASLAGTISDANGTGLGSIEVRLWQSTTKGYAIGTIVTTAANGAYSFTGLAGGDYLLDARMAPGNGAHYGDTWYDIAMPTSAGLLGGDADLITMADTDTLSGYDISLPDTGGFWGELRDSGGNLTNSALPVRAESTTEFKYHHNDLAKTIPERRGQFSMRGLVATHDYRIIAYDPTGMSELLVAPGPYAVTNSTDPTVGSLGFVAMGVDPAEPNNAALAPTLITNLPYLSAGAIIAPRGSDVDWYCLTVADGDRLVATVDPNVTIDGVQRAHPWLDPIVGFFNSDGTTLLASNDDATPGAGFNSLLDTGILTAGSYCLNVSTYGDSNWAGAGQQTAGRYDFGLAMGNREPVLTVTSGGNALPMPPTIALDEGVEISFEMTFTDPDADMLMVDVTVLDSNGDPDTSGTLTVNAADGTYVWTPSQTAAATGPYEVIITITDGEFVREVRVTLDLNAVNLPPTIPILDSPVTNARVNVTEVPLALLNSTDPDADALNYDYQLEVDTPDDSPEQSGSEPEDASGQTTWTTATLAENSLVSWRARADDGMGMGGLSAWSEWGTFLVDVANDPPAVPVIVKPESNEVVLVTIPRISSLVPADPEGDDVVVRFEIATDDAFGTIVATSPDVPAVSTAMTVEWTTDPPLTDGARYFVRAQAEDTLGAASAWSDLVEFRLPSQEFPDVPGWSGDLEGCYEGPVVLEAGPDSITVANVDSSGATVDFELQIRRAGEEDPIYEISVSQSDGATTEIPVDASKLEDNGRYIFQVRTVRGEEMRDWIGCDVGINAEDEDATRLVILRPNDGDVFLRSDEVRVEIQNPHDPDPVEQLEIRYCVSKVADFSDCPTAVLDWTQQGWNGPGQSSVDVTDIGLGETRYFKACAVEVGGNACVMEDTVWFSLTEDAGGSGSAEEGCGCGATKANNSGSLFLLLFGLVFSRVRRRNRWKA